MDDKASAVTTMMSQRRVLMSDEFVRLLRQRVSSQYYDQPQVIDVIARAILISRGIYPEN